MAPEAGTAKRLQKDLARLENKTEKLRKKMGTLEQKVGAGKLKPERFHTKRADIKTQIRGYEKTIRTLRGKLSKAKSAGVVA